MLSPLQKQNVLNIKAAAIATIGLPNAITPIVLDIILNKLGARTLGARSRGSKNVTYRQQTTDKKVNTENKQHK